MKRLKFAFDQYLSEIGRLEHIQFGPGEERPIEQKDSDYFVKILHEQIKLNKNLVTAYVILLFFVFGISFFLVFYYLNSPQTILYVIGGAFLGILSVLDQLRRLWREKNIMEITLTFTKELPPQDSLKVIETLYWGSVRE